MSSARTGDMAVVANPYGLPTCPLAMTVSFSDSCDPDFITADGPAKGLACFHCTGASGCYDSVDAVYCAKGKPGCLDDDACKPVKDGSDDTGNAPMKKKATRPFKKVSPHLRKK